MALAGRGAVTLHIQKYKLDDFRQAISELGVGKVRGPRDPGALKAALPLPA